MNTQELIEKLKGADQSSPVTIELIVDGKVTSFRIEELTIYPSKSASLSISPYPTLYSQYRVERLEREIEEMGEHEEDLIGELDKKEYEIGRLESAINELGVEIQLLEDEIENN